MSSMSHSTGTDSVGIGILAVDDGRHSGPVPRHQTWTWVSMIPVLTLCPGMAERRLVRISLPGDHETDPGAGRQPDGEVRVIDGCRPRAAVDVDRRDLVLGIGAALDDHSPPIDRIEVHELHSDVLIRDPLDERADLSR